MNESLMRLEGKVALITGAAQGIGKGIAEVFAHEGAVVVIADLQEEKGQAAADSLDGQGAFVHTDLRQDSDIEQMIAFTVEKYGALDILINNATPPKGLTSSFEEMVEDWDTTMDLLLRAYMVTAKFAHPYMQRTNGGSIVNMGSTLAFSIAEQQSCAYHVAKAGVTQLTRYLAWELGNDGIQVNCICPALVDRSERPSLTNDPTNQSVVDITVPLKRAGNYKDIAYTSLFLCSDEAKYLTGQSIILDGGLTLGSQFEVAKAAYKKIQS